MMNRLKSKKKRKKFGLTISFGMGWQHRSSGNKYASLSGHIFLIGIHTCRVVACIVFSKKCSICEKKSITESTGTDTVSTVSTSSITTTKCTGYQSASPAASPSNSIFISDVQSAGSESTSPIRPIRLSLRLVNHSHNSISTLTTTTKCTGNQSASPAASPSDSNGT